jgi:hypothetical protein
MSAFTTAAMRPRNPIVGAARRNWRRRRLHFRLRSFGRALASMVTDARGGLLGALHHSRRLLAARVIDQHRYLVQDFRCIGVLHCADDAGFEAQQIEP